MKTIAAITLLILSASSALAGVYQYVEEGEDKIVLSVRCKADDVHWCNCAIAGGDIAPTLDDAFMCWSVEGDKIIFSNTKLRFEKRLDELKIGIDPEPTSPTPSSSPRPENPNPSRTPSGSLS
jgi:hypothetical protein